MQRAFCFVLSTFWRQSIPSKGRQSFEQPGRGFRIHTSHSPAFVVPSLRALLRKHFPGTNSPWFLSFSVLLPWGLAVSLAKSFLLWLESLWDS